MYVNNKTQINPIIHLVTISHFAIVAIVVCSTKCIIGHWGTGPGRNSSHKVAVGDPTCEGVTPVVTCVQKSIVTTPAALRLLQGS